MNIYNKIKQQISIFLSKSPSQQQLKTFLKTILYDQSPTQAFHRLNLQSLKQPQIVYTKLMVQDIRQNYYVYPYVIEKPFNQKSNIQIFKFGNQQKPFSFEKIQNEDNFSFICDTCTISCALPLYQTQWVRNIQKNVLKDKNYEMITYQQNLFNLGQVFSAICLYQPKNQILHFIRKANQIQISKWDNINEYLSKQINPLEVRENLLKKLCQVYSQKYSHFLLYSFLSSQHLFISALSIKVQSFQKILPRVCSLNIRVPFKQSLFPYKKQVENDQQIIVRTPMQMSNEHTYVIIDFSNFSKQQTVKIENQEIDNLKALKVFVQDGKTIYRWLYGESLIDHPHTGIIVKASAIINPQYLITQKLDQIKEFPQFTSSQLRDIRCYIHQVRKIKPLVQNDKQEILKIIESQATKFIQTSLIKTMELSKLNAQSRGSSQIKKQDFQLSCKLFF